MALSTRGERPSTSGSAEKLWLRRKAAPKTPILLCLTLQVPEDEEELPLAGTPAVASAISTIISACGGGGGACERELLLILGHL